MKNGKKAILVLLLLLVCGIFLVKYVTKPNNVTYMYKDDFNELNQEEWFIGEWGTGLSAPKRVTVEDGVLEALVRETDRAPIVMSKPFPIDKKSLVTIKRRVKLHYGNEVFTGGMSILQTDDQEVAPISKSSVWYEDFGQSVLLMEYVHDESKDSVRPGRHNFRLLIPGWDKNDNYGVMQPIFDEWFVETLTLDCMTGRITYKIDDKSLIIKGYKPDKNFLRVMMHPYGFYTGHEMQIDWMEIKVERIETRVK